MFSADRNAVLTVKIHSRPLTATQRAKWKENDYDVVLQVTNNTEHVLSLPKTLTSSSADVLCRSGHCWSVNDKQYHDQHSHQFNFNCSRKAIKIPPTGTLKVDKPCIIFSGIQRTKLRHKKTQILVHRIPRPAHKATGIQSTVHSTVIQNSFMVMLSSVQRHWYSQCTVDAVTQVIHGSKQCPTVPNGFFNLHRQPRRRVAFVWHLGSPLLKTLQSSYTLSHDTDTAQQSGYMLRR